MSKRLPDTIRDALTARVKELADRERDEIAYRQRLEHRLTAELAVVREERDRLLRVAEAARDVNQRIREFNISDSISGSATIWSITHFGIAHRKLTMALAAIPPPSVTPGEPSDGK